MSLRWLFMGIACTASLPACVHAGITAGQDYYSWQIASATDAESLEKAYTQYRSMPFVRIEQRERLYVLRAGFWSSARAAREALSGTRVRAGMLRIASFRPQMITHQNWGRTSSLEGPTTSPVVAASIQPATVVSGLTDEGRPSHTSTEQFVGDGFRAFDSQDFVLAFDVLVGSGDLKRAFEVAQKAVRSVPQDRAWRIRLAKVSQWVQRPEVMAEQWLALFEQGDHSPTTVAKVIQLAPLANQPLIALRAWTAYAAHQTLSEAQWQDIFSLYESAAEPTLGARFFENQFQTNRYPLLLEYAARLAENGGDDGTAERLYVQRAGLRPFSLDVILRAVVVLVRHGKLSQALTLMRTHTSEVPVDAVEYWRLLSEIAWELRDYDAALEGYGRYARLPEALSADWARMIFLVRRQHPRQAADLAIEAYKKFGSADQLLQGLGIYADLDDVPAQARVYAMLGRDAALPAGSETRFLLLRARFHQRQKKLELAGADLRRALVLSPGDMDPLMATLWYLIDSHQTDNLSIFLRTHGAAANAHAQFWPAYAAANQVLERHRAAVRWYSKIVNAKADDPLVLLNYADALQRTGNSGMGDRVRRHAWQQLKSKYPDPAAALKPGESPELLALARLSLMEHPGDPGLALVRQLVEEMRGLPPRPQNEQTMSLILGWAILKEQFHNARSWMWRRYAAQSLADAPLWGKSQVAIQLKDSQTMDSLLRRNGDALPIYNRYDTAYELGHVQQAIDIAFKGMEPQDDEPLYDRYRQHVPLHANYLQLEDQVEQGGTLDSHQVQLQARFAISSKVHVLLSGTSRQQSSMEPRGSALAPDLDRLGSAEVRWASPRGLTSLTLFQREALVGLTGARLGQAYQWGSRLNLDTAADYRSESRVSQPMRVAGYENSVAAGLGYTLGRREYVRVAHQFAAYYTQFGDALGTGQRLDVEAGYRLRTDYPDWRVRAFAKFQRYDPVVGLSDESLARLPTDMQSAISTGAIEPTAYFLPDGSNSWGACFGMGENLTGQNLQTNYSRAWRPFVNVCLSQDTVAGSGIQALVGVAGSVTGEDHLRLQWESSDSTAPGQAASRALALRYRHYF